ncbi:hypothetical protein C8R47DRAFT_98096 [Mycena vitilis]|nr:hypothetical protein C8R47DRAFT_98096 [Mycena vitilis]
MNGVPPHLNPAPGTRHHALLTSNEPPRDRDIPTVQSVLYEIDARLASLDDEIARASEQLEKLKEKRSSLASHRRQNGAILSLLRRMPLEILGEIFMLTLPFPRPEKGIRMTDSPWVLTHVCRDWKRIALSVHSLWSSVIVTYYDPETGRLLATCPKLAMVETQIARAQEAKLKIHFYGFEDRWNRTPVDQIEMFKALARHATRWGEFSAQLTPALLLLLADLRGSLSSLRKLWLRFAGEMPSQAPSIDTFEDLPCLRDIGLNYNSQFFPIHFPAHNLTRYQLEAPWDTHRRLLPLATSVVEACITLSFPQAPIPDSRKMIELKWLRRLYVSDWHKNLELLKPLSAPVLEELALGEIAIDGEGGEGGTEIPPHLDAFLARSSSIRSLRLAGRADPDVIVEILHRYPSIVELAIAISGWNIRDMAETLITDLTISDTAPPTIVAPQLRSLSLGWDTELECPIDSPPFLEMVKSRMKTEHCDLKQIALLTEQTFGPNSTVAELRMLREEGLDLLLLEGVDASEVIDGWIFHRRY